MTADCVKAIKASGADISDLVFGEIQMPSGKATGFFTCYSMTTDVTEFDSRFNYEERADCDGNAHSYFPKPENDDWSQLTHFEYDSLYVPPSASGDNRFDNIYVTSSGSLVVPKHLAPTLPQTQSVALSADATKPQKKP
jgi:hypothetical protein